MIHLEANDGCTADRIQTTNMESWVVGPGKVVGPLLPSRVKQGDNGARFVVEALGVTPLVGVAVRAGQCEVLKLRRSPRSPRQDMVYWETSHLSLGWQKAVFTTAFRAGSHE